MFKPRQYGDGDGWTRPPMEYVSYEVGRLLDLDLIPPVAYRYHVNIDGKYFFEGSMQLFAEGVGELRAVDQSKWNVNAEYFISNARVLDVLLQNPDRHEGNFLYAVHWVDGIKKPMLIDQAANMRKGTNMRLSTKGPLNSEAITNFDPHTVMKLRELDKSKLAKFMPFITADEVQQILRNRDGILQFIDSRSSGK